MVSPLIEDLVEAGYTRKKSEHSEIVEGFRTGISTAFRFNKKSFHSETIVYIFVPTKQEDFFGVAYAYHPSMLPSVLRGITHLYRGLKAASNYDRENEIVKNGKFDINTGEPLDEEAKQIREILDEEFSRVSEQTQWVSIFTLLVA